MSMNVLEREVYLEGYLKGFNAGIGLIEEISEDTSVPTAKVKKTKNFRRENALKPMYSEADMELIKDTSKSNALVAQMLGRTETAIYQKRFYMGLKENTVSSESTKDGLARLGQIQ